MNIRNELQKIAERYGLSAIYAFGSRAAETGARVRGKNHPAQALPSDSDLDLGIQPSRRTRLTARDKVRLSLAVEDLFQVPGVDLVVIPEVDPFLALEIIRGELLFCTDPDEQAEHELHVLRRAGDLASYERERRRLILSGAFR